MDAETREALRIVGNALENAPSRPRSQGKQALSRIEQTLRDLSERTSRAEHIIECADTPLMRDVLRERDALAERVERAEHLLEMEAIRASQWEEAALATERERGEWEYECRAAWKSLAERVHKSEAAEAEAARLREALERIAEGSDYTWGNIARLALSPPTDGEAT